MTTPTGKNVTFDQRKDIEVLLRSRLTQLPDGRWTYPEKQNDETIAKLVQCSVSSVSKMRNDKFKGGLRVQQINRAVPSAPLQPVEPEPTETQMEAGARMLEALFNKMSAKIDEQSAAINAQFAAIKDLRDYVRGKWE